MHKKISVIIPVYNGERYIRRCIDSVLHQENFNVGDLEVLLLNDGSSDGSLEILRQYKKEYSHIVEVIDHKNMGVALTRNKGIELSTGEYIIFMDQDDFIEPDYCRVLYDAIQEVGSDVVLCGFKRPDKNNKVVYAFSPKGIEYEKFYLVSAWGKIHNTNFLKNNKITFFNGGLGEDIPFTLREISKATSWRTLNYVGYNWFYNEDSVSNTSQKGIKNGFTELLIKLLEELNKIYKSSEATIGKDMFNYFLLQTVIAYLLVSGRTASSTDFMKTYRDIFDWLAKNIKGLYKNKLLLLGPDIHAPKVRLGVPLFLILHKSHLIYPFSKIYCKGKR